MASTQKQKTAFGGSVVGSLSAVLPGWLAFVAWHVIMNACQRRWLVFICWLLLYSCCIVSPF
jgi:hypothetical protein